MFFGLISTNMRLITLNDKTLKKIVVSFPHEWVAYSPTILNLVEIFRNYSEIKVLFIDNGKYNNRELPDQFISLKVPPTLFKILALVGLYEKYKILLLTSHLKRCDASIAIGVDNVGMFSVQRVYPKGHFLSLEIKRDKYFGMLSSQAIQSIAIQSEERLKYLYTDSPPFPVFFIPNSPIYYPFKHTSDNNPTMFKTIFLGNIIPSHGIYHCIDAINGIPFASITLKGHLNKSVKKSILKKYKKLILEGRLIIDEAYTQQSELIRSIQSFDAGFCLYDFEIIKKNDFNYISSPSGKMYTYFAAGVPIIGSDILGLRLVKDFNAGCLLQDINIDNIGKAIETIRFEHELMRLNCLNAAKQLDFMSYAMKYLKFVLNLK